MPAIELPSGGGDVSVPAIDFPGTGQGDVSMPAIELPVNGGTRSVPAIDMPGTNGAVSVPAIEFPGTGQGARSVPAIEFPGAGYGAVSVPANDCGFWGGIGPASGIGCGLAVGNGALVGSASGGSFSVPAIDWPGAFLDGGTGTFDGSLNGLFFFLAFAAGSAAFALAFGFAAARRVGGLAFLLFARLA